MGTSLSSQGAKRLSTARQGSGEALVLRKEQRILAFVVLKIYLASHALSKKRGQSVSDGVSRASLGVLAFPTLAVLLQSLSVPAAYSGSGMRSITLLAPSCATGQEIAYLR